MNRQQNDSQKVAELWADYARTQNPRTRDAIVMQFERLAYSIANRYAHRGVELDDVCQVAKLALVNAVDRFDPATNFCFSSFATPTIQGEIRRFFRDRCRTIHVPRGLQELSLRVQRVSREIEAKFGRRATVAEIASRLQVSESEVAEALTMEETVRPLSLDSEADWTDSKGMSMEECLGHEDQRLRQAEDGEFVRQALQILGEQQQAIIRMRYLKQMTQRDVAERLGCSQMRISRLERHALDKLRTTFIVVN